MKIITPQTSKGPADRFTGDVYPTLIFTGEAQSRVRMAKVRFTPGAHTAWHSHVLGQYLHIVEGIALVQERGGGVQVLNPGDTVYTDPGVEHWHGASPHSFMVHLAIWEASAADETETNWGQHVTTEEYDQPGLDK